MEKWVKAFKNDMKMAFRTVKSGWKTYIAMFAALALVQMLFGFIGISFDHSRKAERDAILANYDCHIELTNLSDADHYYLADVAARMQDPYFEVRSYRNDGGTHTTGIFFHGDVAQGLASFLLSFEAIMENGAQYTCTPLYVFDSGSIGEGVEQGMIFLFCAAISLLVLTILNSIRINHFKFEYGIYMSFGADFKRLSRITVCETLCVFLMTYLPAMLVSYAAVTLMSVAAGGSVYFSFMPFVWAFIIPLIVSIIAIILPVRTLTMRRPTAVMLAQDNSNQVFSPRLSRIFSRKSFPVKQELLSLWRFGGYGLKLAASATLFAVLFVGGLYAVSFYGKAAARPTPQYTVSLSAPDDAFVKDIEAIEGLTVLNGAKANAKAHFSHILFSQSMVEDSAFFADFSGGMVTEKLVYRPADAGLPAALTEHYGYELSGDSSAILKDGDSLIISDSLASKRVLNIEPGDTVYLAVYGGQYKRYNPNAIYSEEELLQIHLENYTFTYRAFTVAAVIHNEPDRNGICVYLPDDVYSEITGEKETVWSVYADSEMDEAQFARADDALRTMVSEHYTATVADHEARLWRTLSRSHNFTGVYTAVFCLVLALVPLVWFFSLILFNQKRKVELDVYRALGATNRQIGRIFLLDGGVYALLGAIMFAVAAPICTYFLRNLLVSEMFFSFFLQSYADKPVYLSATPDILVYVGGILLTALSAFAASIISMRTYQKQAGEHISENFSEED